MEMVKKISATYLEDDGNGETGPHLYVCVLGYYDTEDDARRAHPYEFGMVYDEVEFTADEWGRIEREMQEHAAICAAYEQMEAQMRRPA